MRHPQPLPVYCSIDYACRVLAKSRAWVDDLVRERRLRAIQIGSRRYVNRADLEGLAGVYVTENGTVKVRRRRVHKPMPSLKQAAADTTACANTTE